MNAKQWYQRRVAITAGELEDNFSSIQNLKMCFKLCLLLFFIIAIDYSEAAEICCSGLGCFSDNYPFDHLPLPSCPDVIKPIFNLYTRSNRNSPQRVYRNGIPSLFRGGKRTVFLVHGFNNNENVNWIIEMKNAFLTREDANVIVTGWGGGAQTIDYPWATSNTRVVGSEIGVTAENLLINGGASLSRMWCVGHSLGAHTCGHAGKRQKFARITGLDPAGPLFENYDIEAGLNPSRANFVDIIHTAGKDGGVIDFGTLKALGHADFYPNNGGFQPGCFLSSKNDARIGCSHGRANLYFTESVLGVCKFYAKQRCTDNWDIPGSCSSCSNCATMGYDAIPSQKGNYNLPTNSNRPFCRG